MNVLYRMCGSGSTTKHRPQDMDKSQLVQTCYNSFITAFMDVQPHVTFLIDKPTLDLVKLADACPFQHDIEIFHFGDFNEGNIGTFHRQLDLAENMDKVLFLEDDYYFLPDAGKIINEALEVFDFLTPYDHPGYYNEPVHHYKREVEVAVGRHWQTVISTCLTFAGHGNTIKGIKDVMKDFGWADHPMWVEITKHYKLWSPIPSLATHMEVEYLSPNVSWGFME